MLPVNMFNALLVAAVVFSFELLSNYRTESQNTPLFCCSEHLRLEWTLLIEMLWKKRADSVFIQCERGVGEVVVYCCWGDFCDNIKDDICDQMCAANI